MVLVPSDAPDLLGTERSELMAGQGAGDTGRQAVHLAQLIDALGRDMRLGARPEERITAPEE